MKIGKLSTTSTNSAGKKVDEWVFTSPFGKQHRCVVKIFGDYQNGMRFTAYPLKHGASAQGEPMRGSIEIFKPITDTDINRLKESVEEAYRFYDEVANGASWEDWLEVKIDRRGDNGLFGRFDGSEISIGYRWIKKAVLPDGREVCANNEGNYITKFPEPKAQGVEDPKPTGQWAPSSRDKNAEYAYIPATEENIKVLENMVAGLRELHSRVSVFVRASNATGLLDASGLKALPNPSED